MPRKLFLLAALTAAAFSAGAQQVKTDASMYKLLLPSFSEFQSIVFSGVFRNAGTDTLKSVDINWTINNGPVSTISKRDLAVARYQSWPFTAPENLVMDKEGNTVVKVWTSMPNGVADGNNANDTLTQVIQVIRKYPEKHMLIEEVTGAWCGYCPRAPIIYRASVLPAYPNTIFAAIHTGDGMVSSDSRDFMNTYVTGVPCGFVDRKRTAMDPGIDFAPEDWQPLLGRLDNRFNPAELHVYNYYEPATRSWKIDVVADFVFDMTASYRMNCYILEDSLYGTGSSWDQRNFFNGSAADPYLSLQGAGDPIPGYKHHHVVRRMLGGSWGASGIIPSTIKKGDRFVYSQTIKADAKWKMENVHIIGLIQQWDMDKFKRPIINAVEGEVTLATGTDPVETNAGMRIYPNPVKDQLLIEYDAVTAEGSRIEIIDQTGRSLVSRTVSVRQGQQTIEIGVGRLSPGIYYVRFTGRDQSQVRKMVKQ